MKRFSSILAFLFLISTMGFAQTDTSKSEEKVVTGWTFGALPAISYNSDLGFQYGALTNIYYYGDGKTYPKYLHSIYLEISRTTKGSGINRLFYDSESIFKKRKIRVTADLSYLTEQALDFYGFNGFEANYNPDFEMDDHDDYISRMYYRMDRRLLRFTADFQGDVVKDKVRWLAGFGHFNFKMNTVDIDRLNKNKDEADKLPDVDLLYDKYVDWGIISAEEADGGILNNLKVGLVYDTRDLEANPSKGLWDEVLLFSVPSFMNKENSYTKLIAIHRQYFTLVPDRLTFVYRLGYQGTISGNAPFYIQPIMFSSYSPSVIYEGLGGAKSLRGILRNRIVGDGFTYGNIEFRYKFLKTKFLKQNFYLATNVFTDIGLVVDPIDVDRTKLPATELAEDYFNTEEDELHYTSGIGLHAALNQNFVLSINYGRAWDKQDGVSGLYIGLNWLF